LRGHGKMLVDLNIEGMNRVAAIVAEIERDMLNRQPIHIDLHAVDLDEPLTVEVPIFLDGLEAVEKQGGVIQQQKREVAIRCLPTEVPEFILHDISTLEIGDHVRLGDLTMPAGATLQEDENEVVCAIIEPKNPEPDTQIEPKEPDIVHDQEGRGVEEVV
jgi:large subunit ribosomal protein L25